MKKIFALCVFVLITSLVSSQKMYSKVYGDPNDKPIVFLHGGPGYNSVSFEVTTAKKLSENGFYVVVYDRRGEGRSVDKNAKFTFAETFSDLDVICTQYNLKKPTLIGHSFGGIIATLYAEKNPEKVTSILLLGAPLILQNVFSTILTSSKDIYEKRKDIENLRYIDILEKMDKNSMEYMYYTFGHAMQNGFYYPKKITAEASVLYSKFKTDSLLAKYSSQMSSEAPLGFSKNENYTFKDLTLNIKNAKQNKVFFYGMYGKDDGLFSIEHVNNLERLIDKNNFKYIDNCSHNIFLDQQTIFINTLKSWLK